MSLECVLTADSAYRQDHNEVDEEVLEAFVVILTDTMSAVEKTDVELQAKRSALQRNINTTASISSNSSSKLFLRSQLRIQAKSPPAPVRYVVRAWCSTRVLADQVRATALRAEDDSAIVVE